MPLPEVIWIEDGKGNVFKQEVWYDWTPCQKCQLVGHSCDDWVMIGDFHSILYSGDRINGNVVADVETRDFMEFLTSNVITELHSSGWYYSWYSKGMNFILAWLRGNGYQFLLLSHL